MTIFCFSFPFLTFLDSPSTSQSVHWWAKLNIKGVFGFLISITYNSVFIIHNSKMVWDSWLNACLDFVFSFVSITQFSYFWVMSYGNWKHILGVFSFQNSVFNRIFVIKPTYLAAMFDKWIFFFFFVKPSHNVWQILWFFFFFFFLGKPAATFEVENWVWFKVSIRKLRKFRYFKW